MLRRRLPRLSALARQRGYVGVLGLLIVLVIIMILVYDGYFAPDPVTGKNQADTYIGRSKDLACDSNVKVLEGRLAQVQMTGNGQLPSANILRAKLGVHHCPGKGRYQIGSQGNVYCTVHSPAPEGESVIDLQDAPPE